MNPTDILQEALGALAFGTASPMKQILIATALRDLVPVISRLQIDAARANKALDYIEANAREDAEIAEAQARIAEAQAREPLPANVVRIRGQVAGMRIDY